MRRKVEKKDGPITEKHFLELEANMKAGLDILFNAMIGHLKPLEPLSAKLDMLIAGQERIRRENNQWMWFCVVWQFVLIVLVVVGISYFSE